MKNKAIKPAAEILPSKKDWEDIGDGVTTKLSRAGHMFRSSKGAGTFYGWSESEIRAVLKFLEKTNKEAKKTTHG